MNRNLYAGRLLDGICLTCNKGQTTQLIPGSVGDRCTDRHIQTEPTVARASVDCDGIELTGTTYIGDSRPKDTLARIQCEITGRHTGNRL